LNARAANILTAILATHFALLLSRLVLHLAAARPDNLGVISIYWLSDVLVWPVAWIDTFQPMYGARFERGVLLECGLLLICMGAIQKKRKQD